MDTLIAAHLTGETEATIEIKTERESGVYAGSLRLGTLAVSPMSTSIFSVLDFDGPGHADALLDARQAAMDAQENANRLSLFSHLEQSASGVGWHLWIFYQHPVDSGVARKVGIAVAPEVPLENEGMSDASHSKGIEVFPKQARQIEGGMGNMVWLPFWKPAPNAEMLCKFYRKKNGDLLPYFPDGNLQANEVAKALRVAAKVPDLVLANVRRAGPQNPTDSKTQGDSSGAFSAWKSEMLNALDVAAVYGDYLVGKNGGDFIMCRDPWSPTGDRNPSATVSLGGRTQKGSFKSHRDGTSLTVIDFLIETRQAHSIPDACRLLGRLTGVHPKFLASGSWKRKEVEGDMSEHDSNEDRKQEATVKPRLNAGHSDVQALVTTAWQHIRDKQSTSPTLFAKGRDVVEICESPSSEVKTYEVRTVCKHRLSSISSSASTWMLKGKGKNAPMQPAQPPVRLMESMLAEPAKGLALLNRVTESPFYEEGPQLRLHQGYYPKHGVYVYGSVGCQLGKISEKPSKTDVELAKQLIFDDLLVDFPFEGAADKAHAVAFLILPLLRDLIRGPTPLHLVEAAARGEGKTLLASTLSVPAIGFEPTPVSGQKNNEEWLKVLVSELRKSNSIIFFDNLQGKLACSYLDSVLTATSWGGRILGESYISRFNIRCAWICTANNLVLGGDLVRRTIRIRLASGSTHRWMETGFKHELPTWAVENRTSLLRAIIILIQNWIAEGRPKGSNSLGSFERWAEVVGGVLMAADIPGFLDNITQQLGINDIESAWLQFVGTWFSQFKDEHKKVADLYKVLKPEGAEEAYDLELGQSKHRTLMLGRKLSSMTGRLWRLNGDRVVRLNKVAGSKYTMYQLEAIPPTPTSKDECGVQATENNSLFPETA